MTPNKFYRGRPFALGDRWLILLARTYGAPQKPLTRIECRQLKNLANALGPLIYDVMAWVIENWSIFSYEAQRAAGLSRSPDHPHIGFFVTHCQVAVNLMKKEEERAAQEAERLRCFAEINAAQEKARLEREKAQQDEENEDEERLTLEEVYQMLRSERRGN